MPRQKIAPKKRPVEGNEGTSECSRPKRSKPSKRRRTLQAVGPNVVVLKTIHLPWSRPPEFVPPPILSFDGPDDNLNVSVCGAPVHMDTSLAAALLNKYVIIVCEKLTQNELEFKIGVELPFRKSRALVENLFTADYAGYDKENVISGSSWKEFFKELEGIQRARQAAAQNYQHNDLVPVLRGYQSAAVAWMMKRELSPGDLNISWLPEVTDSLKTSSGETVLYTKYAGTLYPTMETIPTCSGGILADEMGLGKTVITLALILNNAKNDLDDWQLVVSPNKINVSLDDVDEDFRTREKNQEGCLDANEKLLLVKNKPAKGVLRSKLNAWYESKLAEMSVGGRSSRTERQQVVFKCVCGDVAGSKKHTVACECCGLMQHKKCCGRVEEFPYVCPSCWKMQTEYPSRATLIIVPPAIFAQWASEVQRHTPNLTILQYNGVKEGFVQPSYIAKHDVVVTTYSVLRAESLYTEEGSSRTMRAEGRYLRSCSPLEKVVWWRVVCDEAQMVESDVSEVRKMTQRLTATHRWCVTGTPIQKGVADLYYLTSFMGLGAFDDKETWNDFLLAPYLAGCKSPLLSVMQQVFWRSTKEQVSEELGVPVQSFQTHILKFTAIEESFYMQEHMRSADAFASALARSGLDHTRTLGSIDKTTLKKLLLPLTNLCQACTHYQAVKGIDISSVSKAGNLGELLKHLIKKTKQDGEESLRRHVSALNGLAGLCCINEDWSAAIGHYREVFRLAEEYKSDEARIDPLQRLHATHNAAEILETYPGCAPPTLRDEKLRSDAAELGKKYLGKTEEFFNSARSLSSVASNEVQTILEEFESAPHAWWVPVVMGLGSFEREIVDKLENGLNTNEFAQKKAAKNFLSNLTTLGGIQMTLRQWWGAVEKHHKTVTGGIETLMELPCEILLEQALECHLRVETSKNACRMCKIENKMQDLECELFAISKNDVTKKERPEALTKGSWKPSYAETALKILLSFARGKVELESWCDRDGKRHFRLLEAMKKEFKQIRATWRALQDFVNAQDELTMCKMRLRLAAPWEAKRRPDILSPSATTNTDAKHLVPQYEVAAMAQELTLDRAVSLSDFKKKLGKLLYLRNLAKDRTATPDPCPICQCVLGHQWFALDCGHCYCVFCLPKLRSLNAREIKCPVCRENTATRSLGFVDTKSSTAVNDISVTGDFSTKVDNVVREVLRITRAEPEVKILIFSTYAEVLKILQHALGLNLVKCRSISGGNQKKALKEFKDPEEGVSVLLLQLSWSSKGLNLVEATHVFLVEPIFNPAEELQAIGRVHRIGQTKPTFVHRFIIKNSIEEKILSAVSEAKDTWNGSKSVTLSGLQDLFTIPEAQKDA